MKPEFFLIAFCILFLGVFLTYSKHTTRGKNGTSIVISSDDFREEIKYAGEITLSDDEKSIKHISPGGYVKYSENGQKISVENDPHGVIVYAFYKEGEKTNFDEEGRPFLARAIREMISWGFDAKNRTARIYNEGGSRALLDEVVNIKSDYAKNLCFEYILKTDSLSADDVAETLSKIDTLLNSDFDKKKLLNRVTADHLKDSATVKAWLGTVEHMTSDNEKKNLLSYYIDSGMIAEGNFNKLLVAIGRIGPDNEKMDMIKKLIDRNGKTETQWISIISTTEYMNADNEKSNLLIQVAKKMPEGERIKTAYLEMAKTIQADADYGRALRAVE